MFGGDPHDLRVVDREREEHHAGAAGRGLRAGAEGVERDRLQGDAVLRGLELGEPGLQLADFGGRIFCRKGPSVERRGLCGGVLHAAILPQSPQITYPCSPSCR